MKDIILYVFVFAAAFGAIVLVREDYRIRLCREAGFDGYRRGQCIYRSRYIDLEYVTTPSRAVEWMVQVRRLEEDERRHRR